MTVRYLLTHRLRRLNIDVILGSKKGGGGGVEGYPGGK